MRDKEKAITCLGLSVVGWLILFGGVLYNELAPYENDFTPLINYNILNICAIAAMIIHLTNCAVGIILLVQYNDYKKTCITGLSLSTIFLICSAAFLVFAFWAINQ